MGTTKIQWCEKSWNPITGCSPVSEGCQNCYARRMANRLKGRYGYPKDEPFRVTFHPERLEEPLHWKKPCRIFVCSMGDLFHASVQFDWLHSIFAYMMTPQARKHIFLILTKRPDAMARYLNGRIPIGWPLNKPEFSLKEQGPWRENLHPHIWFGVSVENQRTADERIPILLQIPAAKRFVSVEPMLGPTDLSGWLFIDEKGDAIEPPIYWIICGGETGPGARLMHPDWIRLLRDQSQASGVPFFFKSWGDEGEWEELACGHRYQKQGRKSRELDGRIWEERPA